MHLYEIPTEYRRLLEASVDPDSGEIYPSPELDMFQDGVQEKLEATACVVREIEEEAKALEEQIARLGARKKRMLEHANKLRSLMCEAANSVGISKIRTPQIGFTFTTKQTPKWLTDDAPELIPAFVANFPKYATSETVYKLDKTRLKNLVKANNGEVPEFLKGILRYEPSHSVTIK